MAPRQGVSTMEDGRPSPRADAGVATPASVLTGRRSDAVVALSGRIALRAGLVVIALLAVAWVTVQLLDALLLVFVAATLAAGALGPVGWLERRGLPTPLAVIVVYLAIVVGLIAVVLLVAPHVIAQLAQLASALPEVVNGLAGRLRPVLDAVGIGADTGELRDFVVSQVGPAAVLVREIPFAALGALATTTSVVFLSVFLLLERRRGRDWILRFVAPDDRPLLLRLIDEAADRLGAYLRAQLIVMAFTGAASAIGLIVLGVPFAVALGLMAFLLRAVPVAGPTIAGAIMVGFALLESPAQAVATLVLVVALQQVEGFVVVPLVQGRVISISPAVGLVAVIAGSALGGIAGALVAIPAVAIAHVVIDQVILPWRQRDIAADVAEEHAAPERAATAL